MSHPFSSFNRRRLEPSVIQQALRTALREARHNAAGLATALAEQTTRAVHAVDLVVRDVQDLVSNMGLESPEAFDRVLGMPDMHLLLRGKLARLPQADALTLVSNKGHLVNSSRSWPCW